MPNGSYTKLSLTSIKSEDPLREESWVASMECGDTIIRLLNVTVTCDQFFFVTLPAHPADAFWVFVHKAAERLLTFNPIWSRNNKKNVQQEEVLTKKFDGGWVRFEKMT